MVLKNRCHALESVKNMHKRKPLRRHLLKGHTHTKCIYSAPRRKQFYFLMLSFAVDVYFFLVFVSYVVESLTLLPQLLKQYHRACIDRK